MRWRCGCGGWKPSAASRSACWRGRNSTATCSVAANRSRSLISRRPQWTATLYDLLTAYSQQRQRKAVSHIRFAKRTVWSLAEAREVLERLIGQSADWTRLDQFLVAYVVEPSLAPTVLASSFATTLEMVREGLADIHQLKAFAPLYVRKHQAQRGGKSVQRGRKPRRDQQLIKGRPLQ